MTEKIGAIKNPLTIIAIFAGIAEVSGTVILPFIKDEHQLIFIYFLIAFPTLLIILFFLTLNFNSKVLYAPSDFKDDESYLKMNVYDMQSAESLKIVLNSQEAITELENQDKKAFEVIQEFKESIIKLDTNKENIELLKDNTPIYVSRFTNAETFVKNMTKKGYLNIKIYNARYRGNKYAELEDYKAIFLGINIPFLNAKNIISEAKEYYPHLSYIKLSLLRDSGPSYIHNQVFIGGATSSARTHLNLKELDEDDFSKLFAITNEDDFHNFLYSFR